MIAAIKVVKLALATTADVVLLRNFVIVEGDLYNAFGPWDGYTTDCNNPWRRCGRFSGRRNVNRELDDFVALSGEDNQFPG